MRLSRVLVFLATLAVAACGADRILDPTTLDGYWIGQNFAKGAQLEFLVIDGQIAYLSVYYSYGQLYENASGCTAGGSFEQLGSISIAGNTFSVSQTGRGGDYTDTLDLSGTFRSSDRVEGKVRYATSNCRISVDPVSWDAAKGESVCPTSCADLDGSWGGSASRGDTLIQMTLTEDNDLVSGTGWRQIGSGALPESVTVAGSHVGARVSLTITRSGAVPIIFKGVSIGRHEYTMERLIGNAGGVGVGGVNVFAGPLVFEFTRN